MNRTIKILIQGLSALSIALLMSCDVGSGFNEVPAIEFLSLSKDSMRQGRLLEDSLTLAFNFRDGDGDLGSQVTSNISLIDSRTDQPFGNFVVPVLPPSGSSGGIEGTIFLKLYSQCCVFPVIDFDTIPACSVDDRYPFNELTLSIQLTDNAGNMSNEISSSPITLICN